MNNFGILETTVFRATHSVVPFKHVDLFTFDSDMPILKDGKVYGYPLLLTLSAMPSNMALPHVES